MISFVVYAKPEPQGSVRAFMPKGWTRPILTSDNKGLKSFRQEVSKVALLAAQKYRSAHSLNDLPFPKHQPVEMRVRFFFQRPESIPKKRVAHVVRPDVDKLVRSIFDALTGIVVQDDSQIVSVHASKHYGSPERVEVQISEYSGSGPEVITKQELLAESF